MKATQLIKEINEGKYNERLEALYGGRDERKRYILAIENYISLYGDGDVSVYSVAGRSEISGNHTDHNRGCVLAASVSVGIIAVAAPCDERVISIKSEGFDIDICPLDGEFDKEEYRFTSRAIIAGVVDGFEKRGLKTGGLKAYTTSTVLKGSGLSSSAAFEDCVGLMLSHMYNGGTVSPVQLAEISKYAENEFFGKPCGLMDQVACAYGGFVFIDFENEDPMITPIPFDISSKGYALCILNTGGNHADLNEDYASIPRDMKAVAALFGRKVLRGLTEKDIYSKSEEIRETLGDRALMRAVHFIRENERVIKQRDALIASDMPLFLKYVTESGSSSFKYLQNVYTVKNVNEQGISLALCLAESLLDGTGGACRVHGGGFAGTIQAFVPTDTVARFKEETEKIFGKASCSILFVRAEGACRVI